MKTRNKFRLKQTIERRAATPDIFGCMRRTFKITGDVVGSEWDELYDPASGSDYRLAYGEPLPNSPSRNSEAQNA
jgi:hypothetical protein